MSVGRAAAVGGLAVLPLLAACGGGEVRGSGSGRPAQVSAAPAAGVVAPAKVEVIAGLTGCKAVIRVDADELRQGTCRTEKADYVITTFPEERLKQTWLDEAAVYGGTYLVGSRWVVGAEPETLESLRARLGGNVQRLRGMGPAPSTP